MFKINSDESVVLRQFFCIGLKSLEIYVSLNKLKCKIHFRDSKVPYVILFLDRTGVFVDQNDLPPFRKTKKQSYV